MNTKVMISRIWFGSTNWMADVTIGSDWHTLVRQGGLHIWAFPKRPLYSPAFQKLLDAAMENALRLHRNHQFEENTVLILSTTKESV